MADSAACADDDDPVAFLDAGVVDSLGAGLVVLHQRTAYRGKRSTLYAVKPAQSTGPTTTGSISWGSTVR
jgi:hypothetical protein